MIKDKRTVIQIEKIKLLYTLLPVGLIATIVNGLIVTILHAPYVPSSILISWYIPLFALSLLRAIALFPARRDIIQGRRITFWSNFFVLGMLMAGGIWGSAAFFRFFHDSQPHYFLVAYVLGGMAAGAAATFSVMRRGFFAFTIPALGPQIILFFFFGNMVNVAMGTMLAIFWILISISAITNSSATLSSINLRFDKEDLITSLAKANEQTMATNEQLQHEIVRRSGVEDELRSTHAELEDKVRLRTIELEAANRRLESANHELFEFTHAVSHDLRAPLFTIDSFTELLDEEYSVCLGENGNEYIVLIRNSIRRMRELIDDLLVLSRVGTSDLERKQIDISHLVGEIIKDLRNRDPHREVEVIVQPHIMIFADFRLIRIALENLLDNAWKYTGKMERARIEFGETMVENRPVYFIADNGIGFDMASYNKLFAPFQRLASASKFGGTGIGLTTVQRIINRHGGTIWAKSEPGKGATFYFTVG